MTAMQAEAGFCCPITMTFAVVPALRAQPELAAEWEPLVTATSYDPRSCPRPRRARRSAGMAMTEKQGGSDVRANTTVAHAARTAAARAASTSWSGTSGSARRRCPTSSSCSPSTERGPVLLPAAAHPARRQPQRVPHPAPEGQARQPLKRLLGDRVARRAGRGWWASPAAACRRSSRWSATRAWTA